MIKYLITDPSFCTHEPIKMYNILNKSLKKHKVSIISLRDKKTKNLRRLGKYFNKVSKKNKIPMIGINSNIRLAIELKLDFIHIPQNRLDLIRIARKNNLSTIVSTHNIDEIKKAKRYRANYITYSPIFPSPNKGKPKGVKELKQIIKQNPYLNIIALGGIINESHIKEIKKTKAKGFASIRYFF